MKYAQPKPAWAKRGRRCPCGATETHYGMSGDPTVPDGQYGCGVALTMGCELCVRRWCHGGENPGRRRVNDA